jgi:hypothetical protein
VVLHGDGSNELARFRVAVRIQLIKEAHRRIADSDDASRPGSYHGVGSVHRSFRIRSAAGPKDCSAESASKFPGRRSSWDDIKHSHDAFGDR